MLKKFILLASLTLSGLAFATDHSESEHTSHTEIENPHSLGVFLGGVATDHHSYASYGLEYVYEFSHKWATNIAWEKTDKAHHGDGIETYVVSALYSPAQNYWIGLGVGKEKIKGHHSSKEDLVRASLGYDFKYDGYKIEPMIALDLVDGNVTTVVGVNLAVTF